MIDEARLAKVQRVYFRKQSVPAPSGKVYIYMRWYGEYNEDARVKKVYLGKTLPERFKRLLEGRVPSKAPVRWDWPDSYHPPQSEAATA